MLKACIMAAAVMASGASAAGEAPVGRYVPATIQNGANSKLYIIDTQTGRVWWLVGVKLTPVPYHSWTKPATLQPDTSGSVYQSSGQ